MKRRFYAPAVLLVGLFSAQAVATVHVYLSNLALLQTTEAILQAGYLAVPNARVAPYLEQLATAAAGGLFFTFSIGAGLSVLTFAASWLWQRIFMRRWRATATGLLLWSILIGLANLDGWNLAASAYLFIVPLATAIAAVKFMPPRTTLISPTGALWPVSAVIIVAALWGLVLDSQMFTTIRDHLLLGNRVGQSIARAYYTYTLYPAEAFKALHQKQIRTCTLGRTLDRSDRLQIERLVRTNDYLPVFQAAPIDLAIDKKTDTPGLSLQHPRQTVLQVSEAQWIKDTQTVLATFSAKQDRNRMLRKMTFMGLLLGFPLMLFSLTFSLLGWLPNLFLPVGRADMVTAILCVGLGVIVLMPVYHGHAAVVALDDLDKTLSSASASATRIRALQMAGEQRRDITTMVLTHRIQHSPSIAERYWLARSLAYASDARAQSLLMDLLDDAEPIVACQALWALGKRRNRAAIPEIIERINASSHWYIQMYGYRALRSLGWVQPRSPQFSY